MDTITSRCKLFDLYAIDYDNLLGEGSYGTVYPCINRFTSENLALKKIPKEYTSNDDFLLEMNALLLIASCGGHPNICTMQKHFDEDDSYMLVLNLIRGKELFEHLIDHGAYSEVDAARLVRQVASALDYLHGIGVVHSDMKPEKLMLERIIKASDAGDTTMKLVDFGCAEVGGNDNTDDDVDREENATPMQQLNPARVSADGDGTRLSFPPDFESRA